MAAGGVNLARVDHDSSNPAKMREIRIGLVMYGGVSLAIYINGVAHEFFRAVHGNGIYKLLKRMIDADVIVDIISGTSAGGINGIFLGYALANGKRFDDMADLWRSDGDIMQLLRKPPALPDPCLSALDSDRYHDQLRDAFARLEPYCPIDDEPSALQELDLFVTGTDVDGNTYTTFDDSGHPIDVKDHRTVFHLKHRADRKTPFLPSVDGSNDDPTHRALARLARLTSCFPAAFQSVDVKGPNKGADNEAIEHQTLATWGALGRPAFFLDGGVLDNKPFSYTTREIFYRTAERPVERYLFYVEPDPEKFDKRKNRDAPPNFLESAYAGTIGIPGYESIADDLQLIRDQNAKLQQYRAMCSAVNDQVLSSPPASLGKAVTETYRTAKLQQLCRRAVRSILKEEDERYLEVRDAAKKAKRDAAKGLFKAFDDFPSAPDHRPGDDTLRDFDIYFHARRIDHLTVFLYQQLSRARTTPDDPKRHGNPEDVVIADLLYALNRSRKLIEIVQFHMETLVEEQQFDWTLNGDTLWTKVQWMLHQLLDVDPFNPLLDGDYGASVRLPLEFESPLDRRTLDAIHVALTNRRKHAGGDTKPEPDAQSAVRICGRYLDSVVDRRSAGLAEPMAATVRALWNRFDEIDALVFPLQLLSGVNEIAEIRTVRISPVDASREFSKLSLKDKLAGDDLGHFSGFFRKSWRSNDIMWGRLDAVCQLTECFLSQDRLKDLLEDSRQRAAIRARVASPVAAPSRADFVSFVARMFTKSPAAAHAKLAEWIDDLLSPIDAVATAARESGYEAGVNQLIAMGQLDIICEEVPKVFADQEQEMAEWGNAPSMSGQMQANARKAEMQKIVDDSAKSTDADPKASRMGRYFRDTKNGYKVGSEGIDKLPPTLLLEILTSALLVTKFAVLSSLPAKMRKFIELNPLYRFCIDWPLRIARSVIIAIRRDKRLYVAGASVVITASVLLLVAAVTWPDPILYKAGHLSLPRIVGAIVLPLIALTMMTRFTLRERFRAAVVWLVLMTVAAGGWYALNNL